ncbi:Hypothetical protein FKW44_002503, partial [Caligus rogercresseyi]
DPREDQEEPCKKPEKDGQRGKYERGVSMRNLVKKDLGMTPYKKIRLQLLSEAIIEKRRK